MPQPLDRLALSRSGIDRAAHRRTDERWLESAWQDAGTRVIVVADGKVAVVAEADPPRLAFSAPSSVSDGERFLLGVDADGVSYFAVAADRLPERAGGSREAGIRDVGAL